MHPLMLDDGWTFAIDSHGSTGDHLHNASFMHQVYTRSDQHASGRVTVPALWDCETDQIVSHESSEIIRMFNSALDGITGNRVDYCPAALQDQLDIINEEIYSCINNGVYKAGFATTSSAYEDAVQKLFASLDCMETHLARHRYLGSDQLTEADCRYGAAR